MKKIYISGIILLVFFACNKDSYNPIPNVRFSDYIDLNNPQYNYTSFTVIRGMNGEIIGNQGVAVLKLTNEEIYVYDLMCPYQHDVPGYFYTEMENKGDLEVICPQCHSHYNLAAGGSPTEGPSQYPLRQYQSSLNGTLLHIWN